MLAEAASQESPERVKAPCRLQKAVQISKIVLFFFDRTVTVQTHRSFGARWPRTVEYENYNSLRRNAPCGPRPVAPSGTPRVRAQAGHQAPKRLRAFVCAVPSAWKALPALHGTRRHRRAQTARHLLQKVFLDPSSTPHAGHAVLVGEGVHAVPARSGRLIPAGPISDRGGVHRQKLFVRCETPVPLGVYGDTSWRGDRVPRGFFWREAPVLCAARSAGVFVFSYEVLSILLTILCSPFKK